MGGFKVLRSVLDTHIILWCAAEAQRLAPNIAAEMNHNSNELWFSPVRVWEILLLSEKGRIVLGSDRVKSVREIFREIPLKKAPVNFEVAIQS